MNISFWAVELDTSTCIIFQTATHVCVLFAILTESEYLI